MKLVKCRFCRGEVEIIDNGRSIKRKVKCPKCGFTNTNGAEQRSPEVFVIKKRVSL